ncbi:CXD3 protein, partial [Calyptomena viridis]|nr:CXD3 protein [Calyptomena viridis]
SLLDAVQEHSPMVGRFWLVVMLLFRILVLATVGSDVFEDEQEEFVCNTQQPGCKPVCYDAAFPISHYRFLVFHVVVLSAPAALFVIFAV